MDTLHKRIVAFLSHHDSCGHGFVVDDSTVAEFVEDEVARVTADLARVTAEAAYWCDEAEGMHAIALTAIDGPPECPKGRRIVQEVVDALKASRSDAAALRAERDHLNSVLDRMHIQRDAAWAERDAALAEVYAMRAVVGDARRLVDHWHAHWRAGLGMIGPVTSLRSDLDALDALRTRSKTAPKSPMPLDAIRPPTVVVR